MTPNGGRSAAVPALAPAIGFALVAFLYAGARALHEPAWPTDFDQLWHAARALWQGVDPYSVVGPGKQFQWNWPLYYPLPAVLLATPFAWMPVAVARVAFATVGGAVLGWAMGYRAAALWPLALSAAYLIAVSRAQWSPLILAAAWVPALAFVATAKPNIGLVCLATLRGRPSLAVASSAAVVAILVSFAARPDWFTAWRAAIANAPHIAAPIALPFGFLLALSVLKWRRADARLLLVMACVPHTPSLYDLVPLFFLCRSLREALILALLTHSVFWANILFGTGTTFDTYAEWLGRAILWIVYLPALAAILARPNRADNPDRAAPPTTWRAALPTSHADITLTALLVIAGFFQVWLPLVTTR